MIILTLIIAGTLILLLCLVYSAKRHRHEWGMWECTAVGNRINPWKNRYEEHFRHTRQCKTCHKTQIKVSTHY